MSASAEDPNGTSPNPVALSSSLSEREIPAASAVPSVVPSSADAALMASPDSNLSSCVGTSASNNGWRSSRTLPTELVTITVMVVLSAGGAAVGVAVGGTAAGEQAASSNTVNSRNPGRRDMPEIIGRIVL